MIPKGFYLLAAAFAIATCGMPRLARAQAQSSAARCGDLSPSRYYWNDVAPSLPAPLKDSGRKLNLLAHEGVPLFGGGDVLYARLTERYSESELTCWSVLGDQVASFSLGMKYFNSNNLKDAERFFLISAKRVDHSSNTSEKGSRIIDYRFPDGLPAAHYWLWVIYSKKPGSSGPIDAKDHLVIAAEGGSVAAWSELTHLLPVSPPPR